MRSFVVRYRKLWFSLFVLVSALHLIACSTAWTGEASNIIAMLVPAIEAALGILAAFGVGLSATARQQVQSWATQATAALGQVKTLIDEYNTAEAGAKPGLLTEIQTALSVVSSNLSELLPTLHITDKAAEQKIADVFAAIAGELSALVDLIPVIQGTVTSHAEVKRLVVNLKTHEEFKAYFNQLAGSFGPSYTI
jgi:hypothetical protein